MQCLNILKHTFVGPKEGGWLQKTSWSASAWQPSTLTRCCRRTSSASEAPPLAKVSAFSFWPSAVAWNSECTFDEKKTLMLGKIVLPKPQYLIPQTNIINREHCMYLIVKTCANCILDYFNIMKKTVMEKYFITLLLNQTVYENTQYMTHTIPRNQCFRSFGRIRIHFRNRGSGSG